MEHDEKRSNIALQFCKECLGWYDAEKDAFGDIRSPIRGKKVATEAKPEPEVGVSSQGLQALRPHWVFEHQFTHEVIERVHEFCKQNYLQWCLFGNSRRDDAKAEYLAVVLPHDAICEEGRCESDDMRYALMAACVEANRNLRQDRRWRDSLKEEKADEMA